MTRKIMDITPTIAKEKQLISGYGNGGFTISGLRYDGSVLVLPDKTLMWDVAELTALTPESFAPLLEASPLPEILLVGCGAEHSFLAAPIRALLKSRRVIAEPMSTGAACRTYNILLAEGRPVAAALVAV